MRWCEIVQKAKPNPRPVRVDTEGRIFEVTGERVSLACLDPVKGAIAALTECTPLLTCPGLAAYVVPTSQPLPPGGKESGRRFRSPAGPASVNVRSFQQSLKAGLLEMMVARQRLGNPLLGHNNKRNAVGQRPRLVGPAGIQIDTLLEKFQTGRDNDDVGIGAKSCKSSLKPPRFAGSASASATSVSTQAVVTIAHPASSIVVA